MIAKAGGISPLLALVESRYTNTQQCINAIAMLACNHRQNQETIAEMKGIQPLVTITQMGPTMSADVQLKRSWP